MATSRKTSGRRSAAKPARKPSAVRSRGGSKAARSTARPGAARAAQGRGAPAAASKGAKAPPRPIAVAKPVALKPVAAKPVAAKSGRAPARGKKAGARPLSRTAQLAKEAAERRRLVEKKKADLAAVRPLGVLPPESRAKVVERVLPALARPRPVAPPRKAAVPPPSQGAEGVTEKDLKDLEKRLLEERRKIMKDMGHIENTVLKVNQRDSSGDLSGYSFHMADAGTDAMEREKAFLFASAEGRLLMEVNDALRRLYNGDYGVCEICEKPISRARLEAMPYVRLCVSCKEKEEKAGRSIPGP